MHVVTYVSLENLSSSVEFWGETKQKTCPADTSTATGQEYSTY